MPVHVFMPRFMKCDIVCEVFHLQELLGLCQCICLYVKPVDFSTRSGYTCKEYCVMPVANGCINGKLSGLQSLADDCVIKFCESHDSGPANQLALYRAYGNDFKSQ